MSDFRPYKFLVQPVIQEVDDDGDVIREHIAEQPTSVYGIAGLHRYADSFELELDASRPALPSAEQAA